MEIPGVELVGMELVEDSILSGVVCFVRVLFLLSLAARGTPALATLSCWLVFFLSGRRCLCPSGFPVSFWPAGSCWASYLGFAMHVVDVAGVLFFLSLFLVSFLDRIMVQYPQPRS